MEHRWAFPLVAPAYSARCKKFPVRKCALKILMVLTFNFFFVSFFILALTGGERGHHAKSLEYSMKIKPVIK